jgi:hypothetical protein
MRRAALAALLTSLLPAQGLEHVKQHYTKREMLIPMRDGKKLFTAIYAPKDATRTYPVMLMRTPYSVAPYGEDKFKNDLGPSPLFGKEGFIFVYQDVRGRMMSEGDFVNMTPHLAVKRGPADIDESTDTFDTVEWVLKNVAGHNGRVGQWGISYPGFYTAAGMIEAHPALKASSPQAPVTDWFTGDDFRRNGALWLPHAFNFMMNFGQARPKPSATWPTPYAHGTADGYGFFLGMGGLGHSNDPKYAGGRIAFWTEMLAHPTFDAFWQARDLRPHLKGVKPAVLTVGGWFDAENLFGALQVDKALKAQSPATDAKLVMGPWVHGGWARSGGDRLGDVRFGSKTSETYQAEIEFPFFMHHLKDAPDPKLPKASVFETGTNAWRRLEAWPPKEAKPRTLHLDAGGKAVWTAPAAKGAEAYVSDPRKPVPFWNGIDVGMPKEYMVADQRFVAGRPDVLVFDGGVLDADLTVAGPVQVHLVASTTGTDADFVVKLIDVYPDDFKDPDAKAPESPWDSRASKLGGLQQLVRGEVMRGKFRASLSKPVPFQPGVPTPVDFALNDIFHTFRKGHRIMVQVQSSWFPLMDLNPQKFMDIGKATEKDFRKATIRIHHGGPKGSRLVLPVLGGR